MDRVSNEILQDMLEPLLDDESFKTHCVHSMARELIELRKQCRWIAVKDQLPKLGDMVLVYDAMFDNMRYMLIDFPPHKLDPDYTHWMLPKAPE